MPDLLWLLLLPVAAASGWFAATRSMRRSLGGPRPTFSSEYIKGLNFLLNEQPDKTLEVFVQMAEVDSDTVETHLVLGNLFRQRGEVDRAISIHQNLVARPQLRHQQRATALLELGKDYLKAGLLDRAEASFQELIDAGGFGHEVYLHLRDLYEQEKEWDQAINIAERLQAASGIDQACVIAHYYCELGETALRTENAAAAAQLAKKALSRDRKAVRASVLLGDIAFAAGDYKRAIKDYTQVLAQNADFLSIVVPKVKAAYMRLGDAKGFLHFLQQIKHGEQSTSSFLALIDTLLEQGESEEANRLLDHELEKETVALSVIGEYVRVRAREGTGAISEMLRKLAAALAIQAQRRPSHQCRRCGFEPQALLWQCPSCHGWGTVRPMDSLEEDALGESPHVTVL